MCPVSWATHHVRRLSVEPLTISAGAERAYRMVEAMDVARRFARSLDEEDYASTVECLAPTCEYEIGGRTHIGPDAILAAYRKSGEWAARTLDGIHYESSVRPAEDGEAVVEFVDYLEHGRITHTHRCEQHLKFDKGGLIFRIKHRDLPGEQEALDRFFGLAGLSRSIASNENG
jgi:hypothetical protein